MLTLGGSFDFESNFSGFDSHHLYTLMISLILLIQNVLFCSIIIAIFFLLFQYLLIEKIFNLIAIFILISFWLFLNGFEFLPLIILIIYVGSIAILFLFIVIIINPDFNIAREEFYNIKLIWKYNKTNQELNVVELENIPVIKSILLGISFSFFYYLGFINVFNYSNVNNINSSFYFKEEIIIDTLWATFIDIYYIANLLYGQFKIEFVLIGFILFIAIVGVIIFGARKSLFIKRQNATDQYFRYTV